MTEQLSDEKQRGIYEWFYPELKGVWWKLTVNRFWPERGKTWARRRRNKYGFSPAKWVHPLYMPDGKPNYQFFITEIVPRLHDDGWHIVVVDSCVHNATIISRYDNPHIGFTDPDPWSALSELLEGE